MEFLPSQEALGGRRHAAHTACACFSARTGCSACACGSTRHFPSHSGFTAHTSGAAHAGCACGPPEPAAPAIPVLPAMAIMPPIPGVPFLSCHAPHWTLHWPNAASPARHCVACPICSCCTRRLPVADTIVHMFLGSSPQPHATDTMARAIRQRRAARKSSDDGQSRVNKSPLSLDLQARSVS